jgi:nicotinamidase-related amidase
MIASLRAQLTIDSGRTAVVLVDAHRGHLDPQVATMPVAPDEARRVRERLAHLVTGARSAHVPIIHVVLTHGRFPYPGVDSMGNPFWRAVEAAKQSLTPDRPSTISGHNLEGSVQTEILPELGPDAFNRDLQVIVIADAVASMYGDDLHVFGLENIRRALGWVLSADEFVRLLQTTPLAAPPHVSRVTGG